MGPGYFAAHRGFGHQELHRERVRVPFLIGIKPREMAHDDVSELMRKAKAQPVSGTLSRDCDHWE